MSDLLDDTDFPEKLAEAAEVLRTLESKRPNVSWTSRKLDSLAHAAKKEARIKAIADDVQKAVIRIRPAHGREAYTPDYAYRLAVRELLTKYDITPKEK